jgi:hypothetical protein
VALVRNNISEELSFTFIRVTKIGELGTALAVSSSETSVLTRATRHNIPEDTILRSIKMFIFQSSKFSSIIPDIRNAMMNPFFKLLMNYIVNAITLVEI